MIETVINGQVKARLAKFEEALWAAKGAAPAGRGPKRRRFSPAERKAHMAEATKSGLTDYQYERRHGLSGGLIKGWRATYPAGAKNAAPKKLRGRVVKRHSEEYARKIVAEVAAARASGKHGAIEAVRKREGLAKGTIYRWQVMYAGGGS